MSKSKKYAEIEVQVTVRKRIYGNEIPSAKSIGDATLNAILVGAHGWEIRSSKVEVDYDEEYEWEVTNG